MLMMMGVAKPIFRLPYTFVPKPELSTLHAFGDESDLESLKTS